MRGEGKRVYNISFSLCWEEKGLSPGGTCPGKVIHATGGRRGGGERGCVAQASYSHSIGGGGGGRDTQKKKKNGADGPAFVTQCPIGREKGEEKLGTFWYHSHLCRREERREEKKVRRRGKVGAFILYDPERSHGAKKGDRVDLYSQTY